VLAESLVDGRKFIAAGRFNEALATLHAAPRAKYVDLTPLDLLLAEGRHRAGETARAYDDVTRLAAVAPSDRLNAARATYGAALGKSADTMLDDLWTIRIAQAKPAVPFALPDYPDGRTVRLADYRHGIVIVNFWYPACGPCRAEFPYLQKVLDKYKDRGLQVLALNVYPEQDEFVVPFMKSNGYGFRPLRTTADWAKQNYQVVGEPTNFLIDQEGRVVFKPRLYDQKTQRSLELAIEELLDRGRK
jgi:thiol-disulfide isomerase/thioredoxin